MRLLPWLGTAAILTLVACDDDPFAPQSWDPEDFKSDAVIYSVSRADLQGRESGFDFLGCGSRPTGPVVVDRQDESGCWDLVLVEQAGEFMLKPVGAFTGVASTAAVAVAEETDFEAVTKAPRDTARYNRSEPTPIRLDELYIIRTRQTSNYYGNCVRYAKLNPLELDEEAGSFRFEYVINPNCNYRELAGQD